MNTVVLPVSKSLGPGRPPETPHLQGQSRRHSPDTWSWGIRNPPYKKKHCLEDRNLLKLRSLDPSCPFFLSDNSIWGQGTQMLQML